MSTALPSSGDLDGEHVVPATAHELVDADAERMLSAARFQSLAEVPSELEWFANIGKTSTRRAYKRAAGFHGICRIRQPGEYREVTRSHVA